MAAVTPVAARRPASGAPTPTSPPAAPPTNAAGPPPAWCTGDLGARAWTIGAEVATLWADEVDRDARFPAESVAAMREAGLLSAMIPEDLGGGGAPLGSVANAVRALAYHCSASALVLAMHQIEIWYLAQFGDTEALRDVLRHVVSDGWLIANANSEVGLGSDVGRSFAAVAADGDTFHLEKETLAVSYGANTDALILNARRDPAAPETEQVLVALRPGSFVLEQTSTWDTMGLRGTCSSGYRVIADEHVDLIFPTPWHTIAQHSVGASTILLNSVWLGIAEAAAARAHTYVRAEARRKIGTVPPSAGLLAQVAVTLGQARGVMDAAITAHERAAGTDGVDAPALLLALRNLKLSETTLAIDVVTKASLICGLAGYKRDSPFSLDRNLRDILGGPLMANNTRAAGDNAQLLLAMKQF